MQCVMFLGLLPSGSCRISTAPGQHPRATHLFAIGLGEAAEALCISLLPQAAQQRCTCSCGQEHLGLHECCHESLCHRV